MSTTREKLKPVGTVLLLVTMPVWSALVLLALIPLGVWSFCKVLHETCGYLYDELTGR
jgi:hypothetical protein